MIKILKLLFIIISRSIKLTIFISKTILSFIPSLLAKILKKFGKRFRFSITFKITVIYALIFSILIFLLSTGILIGFRYFLINQASNNVEKNNQIISTYINEKSELPKNIIDEIVRSDDIYVSIFDNDKEVLYTTDNTDKFLSFYDNVNSLSIIDSPHGIVVILNDKLDSNKETYYIQTYKSLATENFYISTLAAILLGVNLFSLLIIILISSKASRKMLSPIEEMTKTVKTISVEALDTRLNISGSKDELKELAETFNEMIDRIQQSYEQQNQFVSDASHELRTPIAVIQGYANLLSRWGKNDKSVLEEGISAIKSESENMKNLVENLLFLARGDKNTQKVEKESFLINELIDDLIKETKLIDNKKHNIVCNSNYAAQIYADRRLLKEALRIFIDNSVKFTPENGTIKISAYKKINSLELVVEDTGIGIAKEDLPFIFNRFYQVDKARTKDKNGNGLGLSIAKWIITKHNGKIFVESQVNKGTKVSISLPI